jgi:hypothetical protein
VKTAGTSVEAILSNQCSGEDVVTRLNDFPFNRDEKGEFIHRSMNDDEYREIGQHVDALTIKSRVPDSVWSDYFKFSIARNPWSRVVSLYSWKARNDPALKPQKRFYHRLGMPYDELRETRKQFSAFIKGSWLTNDRFYVIDDELCVDFVIRYENLAEDFQELCKRISLPKIELPHLKSGFRKGYHYSEYYDEESRNIVAERHRNDIRLFGYEFESR